MALKILNVGEMLSVTEPWVQPGNPERVLLESVAASAAVIRFIEQLHGELIASRSGIDAARLAELLAELDRRNDRHDLMARVTSAVLNAYRLYHAGTPLGAVLDALEQALFPDGLAIVRASYRETAGRARIRAELLTAEQREVLSGIPVQGGTLLDWVNEWNQEGVRMGELMNERDTPIRDAAEVRLERGVRNRWIRTVRTMLDVVELEARDRPELNRVLDRVADIEAAAERRRAARGTTPDDDDDAPGDDLAESDDDLAGPGDAPAV